MSESSVARGRSDELGPALQAVRISRGHSLRETAEKAGLSVEAVSAVERGVRYPSLRTLECLAMALNITIVVGPKKTDVFD